MTPLILIGVIATLPILLALLFRVHALYVFISVCAGFLLQFALSDDVDLAVALLIRGSDALVVSRILLLCVPVVLTMFLLRKTVGRGFLFQLGPLVFSGFLLAVLALPLLGQSFEQSVFDSAFGPGIKQSQDLVIAAAAASNLALLWTSFRHKAGRGKHR